MAKLTNGQKLGIGGGILGLIITGLSAFWCYKSRNVDVPELEDQEGTDAPYEEQPAEDNQSEGE